MECVNLVLTMLVQLFNLSNLLVYLTLDLFLLIQQVVDAWLYFLSVFFRLLEPCLCAADGAQTDGSLILAELVRVSLWGCGVPPSCDRLESTKGWGRWVLVECYDLEIRLWGCMFALRSCFVQLSESVNWLNLGNIKRVQFKGVHVIRLNWIVRKPRLALVIKC